MIGATPPSLEGANPAPGKAPGGGCVSCAPIPGKPYSSVERRKLCRKRRRRRGAVAPPFRKALFLRRETQTFHPEEQPSTVRVCAPSPGKPYSSVERRKPFAQKSRRRLREVHPTRESLISPSRGANPSPEKPPAAAGVARSWESLILPLRGANPSPGKAARRLRGLRPLPGKPYFSVERPQTFCREKSPPPEVLRLDPGKPYSSVEAQTVRLEKPWRRCEFAPAPGKALFSR